MATRPHLMKGEIPAWQSCGRIVSQERADYWEFMVRHIKPFPALPPLRGNNELLTGRKYRFCRSSTPSVIQTFSVIASTAGTDTGSENRCPKTLVTMAVNSLRYSTLRLLRPCSIIHTDAANTRLHPRLPIHHRYCHGLETS